MPTLQTGTYYNCYEILEQLRFGIGEWSEALVKGLASGTHHNKMLINEINKAQAYIFSVARERLPGFFVTSESIVGVNSVYTLPWDYGSLIQFRDDKGLPVYRLDIDETKSVGQTSSDRRYYQKGQTFVLDKDGVTDTYKLWYYRKPRQIHCGRFTAAGTGSGTLGLDAKRIADYYNGMIIESIDGDWHDTISDYTAARVMTLTDATQAVVEGKFYGIVPELPDFFHDIISERAILTTKLISPLIKEKPSTADVKVFDDELLVRIQEHMDDHPDVDLEQVFGDFRPNIPFYTGIQASG